jgi:hypothetical protein
MNHGNILAPVSGHVLVRDAAGKRVDDLPVTPVEILPGATVDVAAQVRRLLQPGRYGLEAILHASGKTLRVRGAMRLFGVNEIRTENAVLSELQPVKAESGHPLKVIAAFRNTGNVRYAPTAQVQLRAVDAQGVVGPVLTTRTLNVEVADPGAQGRIGGSVDLPEGQKTIDVTVRLLAGDRELDSQSTRAVVHTPPSLMQRLDEFVRAHAMAIVAALAALLLVMAGLGIGYVRRLKAAAREPSGG